MRQRFNDFLSIDDDGLVHFPPQWTEEAKETWMANLRKPREYPVPPSIENRKPAKVKGIYRGPDDPLPEEPTT